MSEQSTDPQQPLDYLQAHPNAVVDPVLAEQMAYADHHLHQQLADHLQERRNATVIADPAKAEHMAYAEKAFRDEAHVLGKMASTHYGISREAKMAFVKNEGLNPEEYNETLVKEDLHGRLASELGGTSFAAKKLAEKAGNIAGDSYDKKQ